MRRVAEVLRLKFQRGLSNRQIAQSLSIARPTVAEYLRRFEVAGLEWPAAAALDEATLEGKLFPASPLSEHPRPLPDWSSVHQELRRKGVTLMLLWQEYRSAPGRGPRSSKFGPVLRHWVTHVRPPWTQRWPS